MSLPIKKLSPPPFLHASPHSFLPCLTLSFPSLSLIAFRQILPKTLPVGHIFSFINTTYLKKFIGIKSLSTKQCSAESSAWIIPPVSPILPKMFFLLSSCMFLPRCMECPAPFPKPAIWGKPCRWGKNPAQQQKNAHFSHQKISLYQIAIFI